jgi:hypothetical protein
LEAAYKNFFEMTRKKEKAQQLQLVLERIEKRGIDILPLLNFVNDEIGIELLFQYLPKLHDNYLNLFLLNEDDFIDKKEVRTHLLMLSGMKEAIYTGIAN